MKTIIKSGDVVFLKNFNCKATVEKINNEKLLCVWFDGDNQLHRAEFPKMDIIF